MPEPSSNLLDPAPSDRNHNRTAGFPLPRRVPSNNDSDAHGTAADRRYRAQAATLAQSAAASGPHEDRWLPAPTRATRFSPTQDRAPASPARAVASTVADPLSLGTRSARLHRRVADGCFAGRELKPPPTAPAHLGFVQGRHEISSEAGYRSPTESGRRLPCARCGRRMACRGLLLREPSRNGPLDSVLRSGGI